jgi:hypothetical protein
MDKMKKALAILFFLSFVSLAFGKVDFGVKFGVHHSYLRSNEFTDQVYIDQNSELKGISAETAGAFISIRKEQYAIHLEAYYSSEGFSIHSPYDQYDPEPVVEFYNMSINTFAMFRYYWSFPFASPFIATGLCVGFPVDISMISLVDVDVENYNFTKIGLCLAAGVTILDVMDIELRFMKGLNDIYSGTDGKITTSNLINLSLGVYFLEIFNRPGDHPRF